MRPVVSPRRDAPGWSGAANPHAAGRRLFHAGHRSHDRRDAAGQNDALLKQVETDNAGALGEIGSWDYITTDERKVFRAVGRAHMATKRSARKAQAEFESKIRRDAAALFDKHGAVVVPNEGVPFPPSFDYAFVTVRADGVLIRFLRGRGEFNVAVASLERPHEWTELELLIPAIETPDDVRRKSVADAWVASQVLDRHWDVLKKALQSDSTRKVLQDFREREETYRKAFERELNRRLYGK